MTSQQMASWRLPDCSSLSARSSVAGVKLHGVNAALRKSCVRRKHVMCAKRAPKTDEAKRGAFKLWGAGKKAAGTKGKTPGVRGTQQIRRRSGTAPKAEEANRGTLKLWGAGEKAAPAKGKSPAVRDTQQIRRRTGTAKFQKPTAARMRRPAPRDKRTVFVAGATGRLGSRIVKCLLEAGLNVVAGVRNVNAAQESSALRGESAILTPAQSRRVKLVAFDLENEDEDEVAAAIGNCGKVVCAAGTNELSGPAKPMNVDGVGTSRLIRVAAELGVEQFVLTTSLGTGKFGWPAGVLNLFWGVLFWKRSAEKTLEGSGMPYTIVRPGGMERPTDEYKETHNLKLSTRDQLFGGQVSRLQVAELVAACCQNPSASEYKTMELVAETEAPKRSCMELIAAHPAEKSAEEMAKMRQMAANIKKDIVAAEERLEKLKKNSEDLSERAAALRARAKEFQSAEKDVVSGQVATQRAAEKVQLDVDRLKSKAADLAKQEAAARAVLAALQSAGQTGTLLSKQEQDAVAYAVLQPELVETRGELLEKEKEKKKTLVAARNTAPRVASKVIVSPQLKDLQAKAAEARVKGDFNQEIKLKAEALSEARQLANEQSIAERAAKLEEDQRAREAAAEASWKAGLNDARLKAKAAADAKRKKAASKKVEGVTKPKATAVIKREVKKERAAVKKAAENGAPIAQKKTAETSAQVAEVAPSKAAEASTKVDEPRAAEAAKKIEASKAEAAAEKEKAAQALKAELEARRKATAAAKAEAAAEKEKAAQALKAELEAKRKAAAAAKVTRPAAAGFRWPWESAPAPEPEELVQQQGEAQQSIDTSKVGADDGAPAAQEQTAETIGNIAEVAKPEGAEKSAKVDEAMTKRAEAAKKVAAAKAEAAAEKKKAADALKAELEGRMKAAAAAKANRPPATGFKWPWETAAAPEPEELVQRRQEAQQWIDSWKAGCENGVPPGGAPVDSVEDAKN